MERPLVLVIATRNAGKTYEIRALLEDFPLDMRTLDDFGPSPEVVEDGSTFEENAYKKASFTARVLGLPSLADDSGLVVPALNGAPGVHSARWAGADATDEALCQKLLQAMADISDRRAAFECVISIAVPGGPALTYASRCEGEIARAPSGHQGFGYDPVFYYPPLGKTFAELRRDAKSAVSHRGKALQEIRDEFEKIRVWIRQHMPVFERSGCASRS